MIIKITIFLNNKDQMMSGLLNEVMNLVYPAGPGFVNSLPRIMKMIIIPLRVTNYYPLSPLGCDSKGKQKSAVERGGKSPSLEIEGCPYVGYDLVESQISVGAHWSNVSVESHEKCDPALPFLSLWENK